MPVDVKFPVSFRSLAGHPMDTFWFFMLRLIHGMTGIVHFRLGRALIVVSLSCEFPMRHRFPPSGERMVYILTNFKGEIRSGN